MFCVCIILLLTAWYKKSVLWIGIDADPHPDPTFHFDADPDLNSDPSPSFTHVGKSVNFLNFYSQK
jgi:hypothetical protein